METTESQYQAFTTHTVDIADDAYEMRVHWAKRDGRMVVVGLDVRAFHSGVESLAGEAILRGDSNLHLLGGEVTTSVLRAVKFAEVAEESRHTLVKSLEATWVAAGEEAERAALTETVKGARRQPGPKPLISDDVLAHVVAPAYASGGRAPVKVVQEALAAANLPGLGRTVSREQASKAVERARRVKGPDGQPLIPPARRKR